jgi:hypothetical protein
MIKRRINKQFAAALKRGGKTTTIRNEPWPVGVPIMLYAWSSKGDRSRRDLVKVMVTEVCSIAICRGLNDEITLFVPNDPPDPPLFKGEGYQSHITLCDWFKKRIGRGSSSQMYLIRFRLLDKEGKEV